MEKVEPLALVWGKEWIGKMLGRLHGAGYRLASRTAEPGVHDVLSALTAKRAADTVREMPETVRDHQLFLLTDDLALRLADTQPILTAGMDDITKECEQLEATLYGAFFALPYQQVAASARLFVTSTPFAIKHGVKGDKLDTVLVVLSDSGAAWTFYSFDKYLSGADETVKPEHAE